MSTYILASKKDKKVRDFLKARSERAIRGVLRKAEAWALRDSIDSVYLFGSAARDEQTYKSDVDLLVQFVDGFDIIENRDAVLAFKERCRAREPDMPDVDIMFVSGGSWRDDKHLFYKNIQRDGKIVWRNGTRI